MMNRRDLLGRLMLLTAGTAAAPIVRALAADAMLHTAPSRPIFSAMQRRKVAILAELVIPRTDTPGAQDAGVPQFIEHMVAEWYTPGERRIFLDGLARLEASCQRQYGQAFNDCSAPQQAAALSIEDQASRGYRAPADSGTMSTPDVPPDERSPFFVKLKSLTVWGYYTSELGATQELAYNPVPNRYDGDVDFKTLGRLWSS